jgi:3',5'-nucleoside bisphosphate phosphatase
MKIADFHTHSNFSDGSLSIPELVDHFGQRKVEILCVTDHLCESKSIIGKAAAYLNRTLTVESFPEYMAVLKLEKERAMRQYGMLLMGGVEITKNSWTNQRSAHMLVIGLDRFISPNLSFENICIEARKQGAVTVAAHPVHTGKNERQTFHLWDQRQHLSKYIDRWEVAAGKIWFHEVESSGLPMIANSDFHRPGMFESWKTLIDTKLDDDSVLESIRQGELFYTYIDEPAIVSNINHYQRPWKAIHSVQDFAKIG